MSITGTVSVEVDTGDLDAIIARMEAVDALIAKYAALIVAEIRRLARVDSGEMRDSTTAAVSAFLAEIGIGEGLPDARAVWNEFGTSRMAAQPMLRPAFERYGPAFLAELQAIFG